VKGTAGAVETILALQSLREGIVPRSLNAEPLDEAVELNVAKDRSLSLPHVGGERYALKNAFGFGGHNVSLVLAALPA
jgi:3-oxoacyl-[acyl-carrier-protein] synthase II